MFGTDDEKTAAQPKNRGHHHRIMLMEAYGENDSEEENEEEDENRWIYIAYFLYSLLFNLHNCCIFLIFYKILSVYYSKK